MIYVSSDWHGTPLERIKMLLDKCGFSSDDFLYVLGDVIDRGDHGVELLKWIMQQPNVQLILGNHEIMLLDCDFMFEEVTEENTYALSSLDIMSLRNWKANGAAPTIDGLANEPHEMRRAIVAYLKDAPLYEEVSIGDKDFVLVHAGLGGYEAGKSIEEYSINDLVWTRPYYDTEYSEDFLTILGHTPTVFYGSKFKGRMMKTKTFYDIDTGASGGLDPMILCLDTLEEFYL